MPSRRSREDFLWFIRIPLRGLEISKPRKYLRLLKSFILIQLSIYSLTYCISMELFSTITISST